MPEILRFYLSFTVPLNQKNDPNRSEKGFKGAVVNRALPSLHVMTFEIMVAVPLIFFP